MSAYAVHCPAAHQNLPRTAESPQLMTLEAARGSAVALRRPHPRRPPASGQMDVAKNLRQLLRVPRFSIPRPTAPRCRILSLRCVPQVQRRRAARRHSCPRGRRAPRLNSATDKPAGVRKRRTSSAAAIFHGEPLRSSSTTSPSPRPRCLHRERRIYHAPAPRHPRALVCCS